MWKCQLRQCAPANPVLGGRDRRMTGTGWWASSVRELVSHSCTHTCTCTQLPQVHTHKSNTVELFWQHGEIHSCCPSKRESPLDEVVRTQGGDRSMVLWEGNNFPGTLLVLHHCNTYSRSSACKEARFISVLTFEASAHGQSVLSFGAWG